MILSPTKVVVIHDTLKNNDPLMVELRDKYGDTNVHLIEHSEQGLNFVLQNLTQKMIVILDLDLHVDERQGYEIFKEIREKTSLVYIIIWTAKDLNDISKVYLVKWINNDFLALAHSTTEYGKIMPLVEKAEHRLELRIDTILEEWISGLSAEERSKIFISGRNKERFTLDEIIESIRLGEDLGKSIEKNILELAVYLLTKQKASIND